MTTPSAVPTCSKPKQQHARDLIRVRASKMGKKNALPFRVLLVQGVMCSQRVRTGVCIGPEECAGLAANRTTQGEGLQLGLGFGFG